MSIIELRTLLRDAKQASADTFPGHIIALAEAMVQMLEDLDDRLDALD